MIRVDRGGSGFLDSVTDHLHDLGEDVAYSPALYPDSTGMWVKSGFTTHAKLALMEHALGFRNPPESEVTAADDPDWAAIHLLDQSCFEGFWGMSEEGLRDAHQTNRTSTVLLTYAGETIVGYAIAGMQLGIGYLHRIAVSPEHGGAGRGAALLRSAIGWARAHGGRTMVLNVRAENQRAIRLYERAGFAMTGTSLVVLRHESA
jgi:ribosomal protein S18 acetylase RimI-like enzyme